MKMYTLINSKKASKFELEEYYTLDEALKLYALHQMETDVQRAQMQDLKKN